MNKDHIEIKKIDSRGRVTVKVKERTWAEMQKILDEYCIDMESKREGWY